eukprot:312068-Pyramimonas_sp.AAC.1
MALTGAAAWRQRSGLLRCATMGRGGRLSLAATPAAAAHLRLAVGVARLSAPAERSCPAAVAPVVVG